ncbi:MAG: peptide chain release factor N(5)-glutamine methyltransferase [Planctomycetes bacterium]|nr:peptide chain release factor N(5)-glutamine methyltransferase [Planctomycetota bacterium]MBL7146838.1 peptide chain release factor N(5)-glutamine methyltransferase [Phycisphaerae bacterium]
MSINLDVTYNYKNLPRWRSQKTKPIQTQFKANKAKNKPNLTQFKAKTNPNKPNIETAPKLFLAFTFPCPGYNLPMQIWTIQKLLNWTTEYLTGKGIESPRLSAELLLSHTVGLTRIELYTKFDRPVPPEQLDRLRDLVKRAAQNEPIAYLVGRTEFYSLQINVTPDCMVPRPETELLVERAIEFLRERRTRTQYVCDLCTGSGCIAVAIAENFSDARIIATDICDAALAVAAGNIKKHQLSDRINLLCGDLFDPVISGLDVNEFDLIVSNPPYVSTAEYEKLDMNVKDYEPKKALFAGVNGLDVYSRIIEKAGQFLKPYGALMLEIGYAQGPAVKELLEQTGDFREIKIEKDFHNNDRIVTAKKLST